MKRDRKRVAFVYRVSDLANNYYYRRSLLPVIMTGHCWAAEWERFWSIGNRITFHSGFGELEKITNAKIWGFLNADDGRRSDFFPYYVCTFLLTVPKCEIRNIFEIEKGHHQVISFKCFYPKSGHKQTHFRKKILVF